MRVVLFFLLRYQFALACRVCYLVYRAGAPRWAVNWSGRLLGTGWACRALFWFGWRHP